MNLYKSEIFLLPSIFSLKFIHLIIARRMWEESAPYFKWGIERAMYTKDVGSPSWQS